MRYYKIGYIFLLCFAVQQLAWASELITRVQYFDYHGHKLYLKEKKLKKSESAPVIVLLDSVSLPSVEAFDVPKYSLMNTLAESGYDVWGVDFLNQGKADLTAQFPLHASEAVQQLHQVLQMIQQHTRQKKVALLGWSWGTLVGAMYAMTYPNEVDHLILYAAMYSSSMPPAQQKIFIQPLASLPDRQDIPWSLIQHHWQSMLSPDQFKENMPAMRNVQQIYCQLQKKPDACTVMRPKEQMEDLIASWTGRPLYDAARIHTPTLVIYGDHDFFADQHLFEHLIGTPYKEQIVIAGASHWLLYETKRDLFTQAVTHFLRTHEKSQ